MSSNTKYESFANEALIVDTAASMDNFVKLAKEQKRHYSF